MTAKEYLSQLRFLNGKINSLIERRQRYKDLATRCTPAYGGMPGGGGKKSGLEDTVGKIVELEREMDGRIADLHTLTAEVEAVIDNVPDKRYREILRMRYLNEWSWVRIATEMELSVDWVKHAHGFALLQVVLPDYVSKGA